MQINHVVCNCLYLWSHCTLCNLLLCLYVSVVRLSCTFIHFCTFVICCINICLLFPPLSLCCACQAEIVEAKVFFSRCTFCCNGFLALVIVAVFVIPHFLSEAVSDNDLSMHFIKFIICNIQMYTCNYIICMSNRFIINNVHIIMYMCASFLAL